MRSRVWVFLGGAFILAVVAAGAFLLTQLDDGRQDAPDFDEELQSDERSGTSEQQPAWDPGSRLFTTNRSRLSVCVDGAAGYRTDAVELEAVRAALEDGLAANPDAPSEYREPLVSAGCPPAPAALTDSTIKMGNRRSSLSVRVEIPNEHTIFVYFMPPKTYAASFGEEPHTKASAETLCTGDVCIGVTGSLYVPQAIGREALQRALMEILGVISPPPRTPVPCEAEGGPGLLHTCDVIVDDIADIAPEQGPE